MYNTASFENKNRSEDTDIVDTSHHALVIAKEENRQGCNTINGDQKLSLPETVNDIEPTDVLHDEELSAQIRSCGEKLVCNGRENSARCRG